MSARRILIIDDDLAFSSVIKMLLQQRGHQVFTAVDGRQGLEMAAEYLPQIIVLDINLPTFSGFDVIKQLKENEQLQAIPVVMVSALSQDSNRVRGLALGSRGYLPKPFTIEQLLAVIRDKCGADLDG
jgi:two-component system phosphate regulon response regulator PhoB